MIGGKVVSGDGLGRKLGFPTANLKIQRRDVAIGSGVYAAYAWKDNQKYRAALVIQEIPWKVEVHLLDYSGPEFYGQYLETEPRQKISELESFSLQEQLKEKIAQDVRSVRDVLKD